MVFQIVRIRLDIPLSIRKNTIPHSPELIDGFLWFPTNDCAVNEPLRLLQFLAWLSGRGFLFFRHGNLLLGRYKRRIYPER